MTETKKTTTPNASVGADAVQPLLKNSTNSITDSSNNCNLKTICCRTRPAGSGTDAGV